MNSLLNMISPLLPFLFSSSFLLFSLWFSSSFHSSPSKTLSDWETEVKKVFLDLDGGQMLPQQGQNYILHLLSFFDAVCVSFSHSHIYHSADIWSFLCLFFVCFLCFRGWFLRSDACDPQRPSSSFSSFSLLQLLFLLKVHDHRHTLVLEPDALTAHTGFPQHFHKLLTEFMQLLIASAYCHSGFMKPQTLQTSHEDPSRSCYA